MKKISALLATALLGILPASAQMIAYEVTTTTADYVGLEGATVVDLQGTVGTDLKGLMLDADGNMNFNTAEDVTGFPIGFDFGYNGQTMKDFLIGTDGECSDACASLEKSRRFLVNYLIIDLFREILVLDIRQL